MKKIMVAFLLVSLLSTTVFASDGTVSGTKKAKIVQTAGRTRLGDFAPEFAHYNDDILFGENWNNTDISLKTKSIITVTSLVSQGIADSSLKAHLENAKKYGVTKSEIAAVITHIAFYAGWPKAWAAFRLAREVWSTPESKQDAMSAHAASMIFPIGAPNDAYAKYFTGQSYLARIVPEAGVSNVTFEPGCRNHWHIHNAKTGGGQILICVAGRGYYAEWGKTPVKMEPGDSVFIKPGVKHWHGAAPDSWFSHLAIAVRGTDTSTEWLEPVTDEQYKKLK